MSTSSVKAARVAEYTRAQAQETALKVARERNGKAVAAIYKLIATAAEKGEFSLDITALVPTGSTAYWDVVAILRADGYGLASGIPPIVATWLPA